MMSSNCRTSGVRSASGISGSEIGITQFYQRLGPTAPGLLRSYRKLPNHAKPAGNSTEEY
jgi:hypothetical protein